MSDLSKDEFLAHIGPMREDIKEIVTLQREHNGRVAKLETKVSVLSWAYGVGSTVIAFVLSKITGSHP
jgi:hypothetical protein